MIFSQNLIIFFQIDGHGYYKELGEGSKIQWKPNKPGNKKRFQLVLNNKLFNYYQC